MKREVIVGDKKVELVYNAATPFVVKQMFNYDIFKFFANSDSMDVWERIPKLEQLAYAMAMQAKMSTREAMEAGEGFLDWLDQFEFDEVTKDLIDATVDMWVNGNKSTSEAKNPQGPL